MNINQGQPCHRSNYTAGRGGNHIRYIVIHFTANNGDTAQNNCTYFGGASRGASAHYFVGDDGIYQSVQDNDRAWHCGGTTKYKHPHCRNMNSIGIEMCSRIDQNGQYYIKDNVISDTVELTRFLMDKYNIPIENVIRHYDVWNKQCPEPFVRDKNLWKNFKLQLEGDSMTSEEKAKFNELVNIVSAMQETVDKLSNPMIYNYIDNNMPEWARPTIQKLVDKGILQGDNNGLNLTDELLRLLVINDRAGLYD
jgi:N-acetylmuramoyl-L-alanine amidase